MSYQVAYARACAFLTRSMFWLMRQTASMLSLRIAYAWAFLSVSPQELLTRAPFLTQPPDPLKMMYSEEEDDEEPPSSSFSGLALLFLLLGSGIRLEGWRAAGLSGLTRTLRACLRELTRPSPFSFRKPAVSEAFVCPSKGCNSTYRQTTKSCLSHSFSVWPCVPPCKRRFQEVTPKSRLGNNPHGTLDITELVMLQKDRCHTETQWNATDGKACFPAPRGVCRNMKTNE